MYKILTILLFPFYIFSQDVIIEKLSNEVNSNNAELNFIQLNDSTSYYTVVSQSNGALLSEIYSLSLENGKWNNKHFSNYNSISKKYETYFYQHYSPLYSLSYFSIFLKL